MKLSCQQKDLLPALSVVQKAINQHNTLPILGNILLRAEGNKLHLSATNLEIAISTSIPADIINEGNITISGKMLVSYIGFLKDGEIQITLEDGETISFISEGSKTKLKGISSDDFPVIPKIEREQSFYVEARILKKGIEEIVFACASSTTRPVLAGVFLWCKDSIVKLAATDSYRLGEKTIEIKNKKFETEIKSIIPARTMQELARILTNITENTVEVVCSKNQILFSVNGIELISRIIDGKFPEYSQIIPTESKTKVVTNIAEIVLAIKRVGLFARENNNNIKFSFNENKILITTDKTEIGSEETEISSQKEGEDSEFALNGQYFLDALGSIEGEKVQIRTEGKLSPVVVTTEKNSDILHVIMPLKV